MRIGMYQFPVAGNIEYNKEKIIRAINDAHKKKIKLLIFPECALTGYPPRNIENLSEVNMNQLEDVYVLLQRLCDDYEMNVVVGTITKVNNVFYNSAILFFPHKERIIYNKRALWGWDRDNFSCGSENGIVQIEDWKIGIRICFEVRFPEFFRELYKAQTDLNVIIFYDVSDVDDVSRYEMIKAHILTRAVENVTYTATVNAIEPFQTAPTILYDKSGRVLCEAERNKEQMLVYDLGKGENDFGENGRKEISNWLFSERCHIVRPVQAERISKIDTYLNCAEVFAYRSTCIKRKYGAVIVKDDVVISTGYNGAPRGFENCCDLGTCPRIDRNMHQGEGYGMCRAIHAEANALLNCSRQQTIGADLYLVGVNPIDNSIHKAKPCPLCARIIIQAGIKNVYLRIGEGADNYIVVPATELEWVQEK